MARHHRDGPAQAIGDDRGHRRTGTGAAPGRYATDKAGYRQMLAAGRQFADRVWAVEGCNGIGRHVAHRLVARRRDRRRRAGEAVRPGSGLRDWQRPQDRSGRCALGGPGRAAHREPVRVQVDDDLVVLGC